MAEPFGVVAGALGVAGLFDSCVNAFEYIQLGRHLGRDFERCQLKLDLAQIRLSRWGQAAHIHEDDRFVAVTPPDQHSQCIRKTLESIEQLFVALQESSKKYEDNAGPGDLQHYAIASMKLPGRLVHNRLAFVAAQRQKRTSLFKKATWALYDAKNFDKLIAEITGLVDDLERLFTTEPARRQIAEREIEGLDTDTSLEALQGAASGVDLIMSDIVDQKIEAKATRNYVKDIQSVNSTHVHVGDEWSSEALPHYRLTAEGGTVNQADSVTARHASRVHVGQKFGG